MSMYIKFVNVITGEECGLEEAVKSAEEYTRKKMMGSGIEYFKEFEMR